MTFAPLNSNRTDLTTKSNGSCVSVATFHVFMQRCWKTWSPMCNWFFRTRLEHSTDLALHCKLSAHLFPYFQCMRRSKTNTTLCDDEAMIFESSFCLERSTPGPDRANLLFLLHSLRNQKIVRAAHKIEIGHTHLSPWMSLALQSAIKQ